MDRKTRTERLDAFSDGVFAVIIMIMVLDLKPPAQRRCRLGFHGSLLL
jgi:uncharacterized membrane protein